MAADMKMIKKESVMFLYCNPAISLLLHYSSPALTVFRLLAIITHNKQRVGLHITVVLESL